MPTDLSNAIWLARRQMRDQWPAYIFTAVYFAFMGAVLAADGDISTEFAHLVLMLILIQPSLSSRYMTWKRDNDVVRQQIFLRSVPLSFRAIVLARLIAMLAAGAINIPVYFAWFWFNRDYGFTGGQFFSWVLFWVGMALIGAAISLAQEFWLSLRRWSTLNFILVAAIACVLPLLIWRTDFRPFAQSIIAASDHPVIMAILGVGIGIAALFLGINIAEKLYRKREFVT